MNQNIEYMSFDEKKYGEEIQYKLQNCNSKIIN